MEAAERQTGAFFVARELARPGLKPMVIDAHEVRCKAHRPLQKSDGRDALELCEAAHHARRPTHPLHPHFTRVCARGGYKTAVVAVAHRLCRILFAMLRDGSASLSASASRRATSAGPSPTSIGLRPNPPATYRRTDEAIPSARSRLSA